MMRAVTAHTMLVNVSPMLVPQSLFGCFPPLPSTTSPLRTKWSTTHNAVTTRNTIQTNTSYEMENRLRLRRMSDEPSFGGGHRVWCSGISKENDIVDGVTLLFLDGGRDFLWHCSISCFDKEDQLPLIRRFSRLPNFSVEAITDRWHLCSEATQWINGKLQCCRQHNKKSLLGGFLC